ncbi:hypothetical protein BDN70DRAFT_874406 [Pholiota conissans]|uniref:Uncharacterized protein n=1 Tax=Pholiota conissans TaxID=109636 RepID=A0A9P5ZBM7_9AGAR|nr:hypothetical protein BDN70DRAFT_874406 [Pholiota conissans]
MDNISVEDELAVVFASASLYGIYLCSLAYCLRWQVFTQSEGGWEAEWRRNKTTLTIVLIIFALTTSYVSLGLFKSRTLVYHTLHNLRTPPGIQPWYSVAICTIANTTALLVDSVLMYRCWLIYGRSKRIIIFPAAMWVGGLVCTVLQIYWQTVQTGAFGQDYWQPVNMTVGLGTVLTPFWGTTLLLNAYTMCALMYRIWSAAKSSYASENVKPFLFVFRILGESGFLYFATTITHFIVWWTPCNLAIRLASQMNIPTIAIAFNILLIRVGQNRVKERKLEERMRKETMSDMRYTTSRPSIGTVPPSPNRGQFGSSGETELTLITSNTRTEEV